MFRHETYKPRSKMAIATAGVRLFYGLIICGFMIYIGIYLLVH